MTDNVKGLLDSIVTEHNNEFRRCPTCSVGRSHDCSIVLDTKHLRAAVEKMETSMAEASCGFVRDMTIMEGQRTEARRERDELREEHQTLSNIWKQLEDENKELKRRLEGAHVENCQCRVDPEYSQPIHERILDPRCLTLREEKK